MIDPDLIEIRKAFAIETAEMLVDFEASLLVLVTNPGSADDFAKLFRTVHTIKGSSSIVRYEAVEKFCHEVERALVLVRSGERSLSRGLLTLLLKCHDLVKKMLDRQCAFPETDLPANAFPEEAAILRELRAFIASEVQREEAQESGVSQPSSIDADQAMDADTVTDFEGSGGERSQPQDSKKQGDVIRVDSLKIEQMNDLVIELITSFSVLESHIRRLEDTASSESAGHMADLIKQIQEKAMSFRMVRVQTLFQRFGRIIHDDAAVSGKNIRLAITGGDTELDKTVAEKLYDPLLHLVRNAVDHGIETPEERRAAGKKPEATIEISALREAGNIVISVKDDGKGINHRAIADRAFARGLCAERIINPDDSVLSYIFEPGFSTVDDPTLLSGRGVGMDVVRKFVEAIKGKIEVDSKEGLGTTLNISIPISLLMVEGLMFSVAEHLYIIPMELVVEIVEMPGVGSEARMPNGCLVVRDKLVPCLDLRKILEFESATDEACNVIIFRHQGKVAGLLVDKISGSIRTPIKPLGHLLSQADFLSGSGILGDGSIAFLLEISKLVEMC